MFFTSLYKKSWPTFESLVIQLVNDAQAGKLPQGYRVVCRQQGRFSAPFIAFEITGNMVIFRPYR